MEAQEVFNTVVTHLRSQGRKSTDHEGCLYRGPNGTSCAVGCLITDEEYSPRMERTNVQALLARDETPVSLKDRLLPHMDLLINLQSVHDDYTAEQWEKRLEIVAQQKSLIWLP